MFKLVSDLYIFTMSPSSFVQFFTAISKLTRTFEEAKRASSISIELNKVIKHIGFFIKAWDTAFKSLKAIDGTHLKNIKSATKRVEDLRKIEYSKNELENSNVISSKDEHFIEQTI